MITHVRIKKIDMETRLKALVSIVVDGGFAIHDIKVIDGKDKMFIAMPSRQKKDGEFVDICHPVNKECREILENIIISCTYKLYESDQNTLYLKCQYDNMSLLDQKADDFIIDDEISQ